MRRSEQVLFWAAMAGTAVSLAAAAVTLVPGEPVLGEGTTWTTVCFLTLFPVFGVALIRGILVQTRHGDIWRDLGFLRRQVGSFSLAFKIGGLVAFAAGVCFVISGFSGLSGTGSADMGRGVYHSSAGDSQELSGIEWQEHLRQVRAEQRYMLAFPALLHLAAGAMVLIMSRLPEGATRVSLEKRPA